MGARCPWGQATAHGSRGDQGGAHSGLGDQAATMAMRKVGRGGVRPWGEEQVRGDQGSVSGHSFGDVVTKSSCALPQDPPLNHDPMDKDECMQNNSSLLF
jgi:hypothetical protein